MYPFQPHYNWYEQYWYSPQPATKRWHVASTLTSVAALVLAVWLG